MSDATADTPPTIATEARRVVGSIAQQVLELVAIEHSFIGLVSRPDWDHGADADLFEVLQHNRLELQRFSEALILSANFRGETLPPDPSATLELPSAPDQPLVETRFD